MIAVLRRFPIQRKPFVALCVLLVYATCLFGQSDDNYVSLHLKSQSYKSGKVLNIESDYYFDIAKGVLVVHGSIPKENIKVSNKLGEVKIYFPKDNTVSLMQNQAFSSKNELLYYFLTNQYRNLGLEEEGFLVVNTQMDGANQVVSWQAPSEKSKIFKVDLVFENDKPIYAAYFSREGEILRKIYYYEYAYFNNFMLPQKVAQFSYSDDGDSIVQRSTYSDIKTSYSPSSSYFNYKIPADAKVVE